MFGENYQLLQRWDEMCVTKDDVEIEVRTQNSEWPTQSIVRCVIRNSLW